MKKDEYLGIDFKDIGIQFPLGRREFLKLFGGGIIVFFSCGDSEAFLQEGQQRRFRPQLPDDFNAFLIIGADERVTCFTGKVELGQGIITSLAQMLADELDVSLESVDMVMGDTNLCPWDMGTFGSMTTRFFGPPLREAAAEARVVLKELAAEYLQVPLDQLVAKSGIIYHKTNREHKVTYGQLTKGKKIERQLKKKPDVKHWSKLSIMGKPVLRRDAVEKVTGRAKFAGDTHLPGMLTARILRPPAHGARLKRVDVSAVKEMKGVQVVQDGDLVAVLHKYPDVAEQALEKIKSQFDSPESAVDDKTIYEHLLQIAPKEQIVAQGGDISSGVDLAASIFDETYLNSYVAHAPIEPHTAVAQFKGNKATVWASTQTPFSVKAEVAQTLGIPPANVHVITPFVGGGFGGKTSNRQAVEASRLAKLTGKSVQVAWSRAEEFFYDTFRPAAVIKIKSGIDKSGKIVVWDYNVYFAGERGSQQFYTIPHHRTIAYGSGWRGTPGSHPFATGAWRAPSNNNNTFARESQIDIMASKAEADPLEFRLKNLSDKRMRRVLEAAAKKFGWTAAKAPSGRGFGIACGMDAGTYVAHMAEVDVDKRTGRVKVKRVVCAQDMGLVVNPEGAKIQMEGCIMMGLGYALAEEIHFKGGQIFDLNFDSYEIPRFSWLPKIETVFIEAGDSPPQGGGEPAIICMGGVIANAIYDASGARLLQLPMTPERIIETLKTQR